MKLDPLLILVRGLPGSGKSTLAQLLFNAYLDAGKDVVALAADDYMIDEQGKYAFDPRRLKECHSCCLEDATTFMGRNYVVIVHNTFTQKWEVQPYLDAANKLACPVQVLTVQGPWVNIHGCPDHKLEQMKERWEWNVLV